MHFDLGGYRIEVATDFGPRITSLRRDDGPEILAELGPDSGIEVDGGFFRFRGGHRLWVSPEVPEITYAPDEHPCAVVEDGGVVTISAPPDRAGLVKEMTVSCDGDDLVVDHRVSRVDGHSPRLAPWAITQFPLGGTAIVPLLGEDTTPSANRYLVLWPYTSVEDRRVSLSEDLLEVAATEGGAIKFGVGPAPGRLGYFRDGYVFLKEIEPATARTVPDFGAVGQVYVGQGFCELESVGGLTDLSNGDVGRLRERWSVIDCGDLESALALTVAG